MLQEKMINIVYKNGHKGQISDGTIPQKTCAEKYYLCGKLDRFMKKCTIF